MMRRIRVHFDAAHDAGEIARTLALVNGLPIDDKISLLSDTIHNIWRKLRGRARAQQGGYPYREFRALESALVVFTGLDATRRKFADMRRDVAFKSLLLETMNQESINLQSRVLLHAGRYLLDGSRTFAVDAELADLLLGVDLDGVVGADVVPPFASFYVDVPPSTGLRVSTTTGESRPLVGFYVLVEDGDDTNESQPLDLPCGVRTLRILSVGDWFMRRFDQYSDIMVPDDVLRFWQVPIVDDWTINQSIEYDRANATAYGGRRILQAEYDRSQFEPMTRLVINLMLYATNPDRRAEVHNFDPRARALEKKLRESKNPKTRKRTAQQLAGLDRRTYTVLSVPTPSNSTHSEDTGRKLDKRVQVCAHWKRQAYGPRRSLRKQILIQPYERGPIGAPDSNPIRVMR